MLISDSLENCNIIDIDVYVLPKHILVPEIDGDKFLQNKVPQNRLFEENMIPPNTGLVAPGQD